MGSVAADIEDGALSVIKSMAETTAINLTYDELKQWFPEYAEKYRQPVSAEHPTGLALPKLTSGNFKIAGITAFMKHQENVKNIKEILVMAQENALIQPFIKPYPLLKALYKYTNLTDLGGLIPQEQADQIDQAQQQQQEAAIQHQGAQTEAEAMGAQNEAAKHGAQADKANAEAMANQEQAGLFNAQAGQVAMQPPGGAAPVTEVRSNVRPADGHRGSRPGTTRQN